MAYCTRKSRVRPTGPTGVVGCLLAHHPSDMLVYLRDGPAQTSMCAAKLRQTLQVELCTSPAHSILTPGRPVPALTL